MTTMVRRRAIFENDGKDEVEEEYEIEEDDTPAIYDGVVRIEEDASKKTKRGGLLRKRSVKPSKRTRWILTGFLHFLVALVISCLRFGVESSVFFFRYAVLAFRRGQIAYGHTQWVRYPVVEPSPLMALRLASVSRKTLILDLDETLVHSHHEGVVRSSVPFGTPPDFIIYVLIERRPVRFSVFVRPHVDLFLEVVSQWYDLVVFTASMEVYGDVVADRLDRGRGILRRRFFRQHCMLESIGYTKDLERVHADLSSVCILDNSPGAYRNFPFNAIPIKSWYSDTSDTCLLKLLPFLDALRFCVDVRSILSRNQHALKM